MPWRLGPASCSPPPRVSCPADAWGKNNLPPELSFVVARGEGPARGSPWPHLPRLRPRIGPAAPRARASGPGPAVQAGRAGSTFFWLSEPSIQLAEAVAGRPLRRAGPVRVDRHRGDHVRVPHGAPSRAAKILKFEGGTVFTITPWSATGACPRKLLPLPGRRRRHSPGRPRERADRPVQRSRDDRARLAAHRADLAAIIVEPLQRAIRPKPSSSPGSVGSPIAWVPSSSSTRW